MAEGLVDVAVCSSCDRPISMLQQSTLVVDESTEWIHANKGLPHFSKAWWMRLGAWVRSALGSRLSRNSFPSSSAEVATQEMISVMRALLSSFATVKMASFALVFQPSVSSAMLVAKVLNSLVSMTLLVACSLNASRAE